MKLSLSRGHLHPAADGFRLVAFGSPGVSKPRFKHGLVIADFPCSVVSVNVCSAKAIISGPHSHYLPQIAFIFPVCLFNKDLFQKERSRLVPLRCVHIIGVSQELLSCGVNILVFKALV